MWHASERAAPQALLINSAVALATLHFKQLRQAPGAGLGTRLDGRATART